MTELLILGGTTEARLLCDEVSSFDLSATVSLAGVTTHRLNMSVHTRIGGFGGAVGLKSWLLENSTRAVVDATHPFARQMPWNAHCACCDAGVQRLRLIRQGFAQQSDWQFAFELQAALTSIPSGKRVLLTTGRNDLQGISLRNDLEIFLRTIEPVENLPAHVTNLLIRPPLSREDENALMKGHRINTLITKDSGGVTTPKLDAARALGVNVILIERPKQPPGPMVTSVEAAVAWLRDVVGISS